ncbi:MAG: hypothetical protein ABSC25_09655 [Roseiarcus sp.]
MAWFLKYYRHSECRAAWTDEWSCACNDKCRKCGAEIEAYDWDELSVVVDEAADGTGWTVRVSPPEAERAPDYVASFFAHKEDADAFADSEEGRLGR